MCPYPFLSRNIVSEINKGRHYVQETLENENAVVRVETKSKSNINSSNNRLSIRIIDNKK